MTNVISKLKQNTFVKNVTTVATGTVTVQIVVVGFAPVITRLYGPEAFGVLGAFMAVVAIISPIAALTYPMAIVLPHNDSEATALRRISLYVAIAISFISLLILFFFSKDATVLLQLEITPAFLYLIPFAIMFSAYLQVNRQWMIRKQQFHITAKAEVVSSLALYFTMAVVGLFFPYSEVLIIFSVFGIVLHAILLSISERSMFYQQERSPQAGVRVPSIARKYIDFPLYRAPQVFINSISQSLPLLMITSYYGPISAGYYSLGRKVLTMPTQLIGNSVGDVFYPRIAEAENNGKQLAPMILKATLALAAIGFIPFAIIIAFGPIIFSFVFGPDWKVAGEYARWLAIWSFFGYINRPSVKAIPVLNLQGKFLFYELLSLAARLGVLLLSFRFLNSELYAIMYFSIVGAILNALLIFYVIIYSVARQVSK